MRSIRRRIDRRRGSALAVALRNLARKLERLERDEATAEHVALRADFEAVRDALRETLAELEAQLAALDEPR